MQEIPVAVLTIAGNRCRREDDRRTRDCSRVTIHFMPSDGLTYRRSPAAVQGHTSGRRVQRLLDRSAQSAPVRSTHLPVRQYHTVDVFPSKIYSMPTCSSTG